METEESDIFVREGLFNPPTRGGEKIERGLPHVTRLSNPKVENRGKSVLEAPESVLGYQVPGNWFPSEVPGTWHQVPGTWYQVLGTWYQVLGTWYQVPGTWYQVLGT